MSLEVIARLRDHAWFPADRLAVPLHEHVITLAREFLQVRGRRVGLRLDGDPAKRAATWRWLSLTLPPDLLVAARCVEEGFEPPDEAVLLVTPRLAEMLRAPCAETHLHAGAGAPFSLIWTALTIDLAYGAGLRLRPEAGTLPFGGASAFTSHLFAAVTVRCLLAAFLHFRETRDSGIGFSRFLALHLATIATSMRWGLGATRGRAGLGTAVRLLEVGCPPSPTVLARRLYQSLIGKQIQESSMSVATVVSRDPIAFWLRPAEGLALPETRLAFRALRYLSANADGRFARLFWQYQRVRCATYAYLVEEPGTAGLDWFTRHYARISPLRGMLSSLTYATSLSHQTRDLSLAALEARTSPASEWVAIRDEARSLAAQARNFHAEPHQPRPEAGLVLHFVKEWVDPRGRRPHGDPAQQPARARYGTWYRKVTRQAIAIVTALRFHPELLLVLRGIDVANVELAIPTWPLVPIFHRVREASVRASMRLARIRPRWNAAPMRATVHAGEDFRRLVEGLRRIHEPLEFGMLCAGDRIGHGVALGIDGRRWMSSAAAVVQPLDERLDDLLWEIERYQCGDVSCPSGRTEYVRAEALRLGREIYSCCPGVDLDELMQARRLRHNRHALSALRYPRPRFDGQGGRSLEILFRYLSDAGVHVRGQRGIEVIGVDSEVEFIQSAQRWLRGLLGRREITIESNPSSNLLIADFASLDELSAFRLQPIQSADKGLGAPVLVSINTDNPVTFASSLADEFAHVYFSLLGRNVAADDALAWLDRARSNGHLSRFTLPSSADRFNLGEILVARRGDSP